MEGGSQRNPREAFRGRSRSPKKLSKQIRSSTSSVVARRANGDLAQVEEEGLMVTMKAGRAKDVEVARVRVRQRQQGNIWDIVGVGFDFVKESLHW